MHGQTLSGPGQNIKQLGQGGFGMTFLAMDMHLVSSPQYIVKCRCDTIFSVLSIVEEMIKSSLFTGL